ncbi:MAG: HTTM domain-containing protein [Nitrospinales bacterium]
MKLYSKYINSINSYLIRPIDASTLGAFRFFFGMLMLGVTLKYFYNGWISSMFLEPKFLFTYELFPWVKPWPGNGMYFHFGIMAVSALFISLGFLYRLSSIIFLLTYTYIFLIDQQTYNNHYYFICLVAFLLCIVNANRWMSLDSFWKMKAGTRPDDDTVPYWNILLLKAQVFIVYFYGGIAKLNLDWFKGEPMRHWLKKWAARDNTPDIISSFMNSELGTYFFSYGGIIFDLGIGFLLIYRKTRLLGFCLIIFFNLTNNWFFNIGIFPFLMIAATILFLEPDTPKNFIHRLFPQLQFRNIKFDRTPSSNNKRAIIFVSIYLLTQILLPFRHWLYQGNVNWTEEGRTFAWHMKSASKTECRLRFIATNPETNETWPISAQNHLSLRQYKMMCIRPNLILKFSHYLKNEMQSTGINNPVITVKTLMSFNFRPAQAIISPNVNLAEADYTIFKSADWILPLKD